jgi:hypothetical protein
MSEPNSLILRRASISRKGGSWSEHDFDVFDGERDVGRIFQQMDGQWFWGVSLIVGRKSYGHAPSLDEAKAAFRAEYERWLRETGTATPSGPGGHTNA